MNQLPHWFVVWGGRVYWTLVILIVIGSAAIMLASCGNVSCDLLGSDRLRDECENGIMVKVYSVPTWIPAQNDTLRSLWQDDEAAQYGELQ
jgi:hypothetical protein